MINKLKTIVESKFFQNFIIAVIILNAIVLGLETSKFLQKNYNDVLSVLNSAFLYIFTVEIIMKLAVYRLNFFKSGWNWFDFLIVGSGYLPSGEGMSIVRMLRILRVLRLLSAIPSMRKVVQALFAAIPSMGSVIMLMSLVFYMFAVICTNMFGETFPQWFGTVGESFYSLFQIMTLESWSMGIVRPVMEAHSYAWAIFVPFILVTTFAVVNLFVAVVVNCMQEAHEEGKQAEHEAEQAILVKQLQTLQNQISDLSKQIAAKSDK